jgi:replicative DNA helicase
MSAQTPFERYLIAERVLTCRMLGEAWHLPRVADSLHPDLFTSDNAIARAILTLQKEKRGVSLYTVGQATGKRVADLEAIARQHEDTDIDMAHEAFREAYAQYVECFIGESVPTWINKGMTAEEVRIEADKVRREKRVDGGRAMSDDGAETFNGMLAAAHEGRAPNYPVRPPLADLRSTIPFHMPGELVLIGGRTGMGKSFLALNYLYSNALRGVPGIYFNLENISANVYKRLWQMHSGVKFDYDLSRLSDGEKAMHRQRWNEVHAMPFTAHYGKRTVQWVTGMIRRAYYESGIAFAVVDYVQLLKDTAGSSRRNRTDELADISAELKTLALELNIVVFGLVQINRATESRGGSNRPTLADIRGSGDLEQDADMVLLLYRPEYYGVTETETGESAIGLAEVAIGKGRECGTDVCQCRFDPVRGFHDEPKAAPDRSYQFPQDDPFAGRPQRYEPTTF